MKTDTARYLTVSEETELLVKGAVGRRKTSSALSDRNDFACFAHARFLTDPSRGGPVMQEHFSCALNLTA